MRGLASGALQDRTAQDEQSGLSSSRATLPIEEKYKANRVSTKTPGFLSEGCISWKRRKTLTMRSPSAASLSLGLGSTAAGVPPKRRGRRSASLAGARA